MIEYSDLDNSACLTHIDLFLCSQYGAGYVSQNS